MNAACPKETETLWVMNVVQISVRVHVEISGSVCYNLLCTKPKPMRQTLLNLILTESQNRSGWKRPPKIIMSNHSVMCVTDYGKLWLAAWSAEGLTAVFHCEAEV